MNVITLGEHIRELREWQGKTLREVAGEVQVSPSFLSDVELSKRIPTDGMMRRIAAAIGVRFSELKEVDTRPPIREFKKACQDPEFSLVMRRLLESGISPLEIDAFLNTKIRA